ncbi:FUSC family protein [Pseudonocardia sp. KRD291]|uniref:FUSC family protein n=1 Tax=Pseudonocardia sp. KRD291 TaxID=2792007 RepID=UPI001C4A0E4F|nr:FUSC family protein [Pseudonocardia sp. KRD291]MBW0106227.1 FUSC family protein [Pseudonocardia sp. KRD291]
MTWWSELRTRLAAIDPGRTRLHLASVATASMMLAAGLMSVLRTATGQPVTVVMFAVVLAMVSNLAVNEPVLARRRVTTALMILPAAASAMLSSLLASNRIVADVVFVLVMMGAVAIRRWGPRFIALGMAAFMPYFFVQFLQAGPAELPYLLAGVGIGIGTTFVLRCLIFTEPVDRVVDRLLRAFEARLHALELAVLDVLEAGHGERELDEIAQAQARLNETALLVADRLDEAEDGPASRLHPRPNRAEVSDDAGGGKGDDGLVLDGLRQWIVDSELAAERLAVSTRRLVEHRDPVPSEHRAALADGVRALVSATSVGTPRAMAASLYESARSSVHRIVDLPGGTDATAREQRIAFAVVRVADAMQTTVEQAQRRIDERRGHRAARDRGEPAPAHGRHETDAPAQDAFPPVAHGRHESAGDPAPASTAPGGDRPGGDRPGGDRPGGDPAPARDPDRDEGLALHTRQAVQVGVATSLAIVVGELISPARWYWAVIAAFVVFAGASSRGDVLSRGWERVLGTAGGVVAGMLLALVVGGNLVLSLVLLFACVFLALYLVKISQAMMAFWITAVLALLYGVIGQFSVATLLLRVEETAIGGVLGMLAAFLVLPTRSRTAFGDALVEAVDGVVAGLTGSVDRILGRPGDRHPLELARELDASVSTVRTRARPLEHPIARRPLRRGVHHTVRIIAGLDYYVRMLASLTETARSPGWAGTLDPATDRVRENLEGLREILREGYGPSRTGRRRGEGRAGSGADAGAVRSAEDLIDAAEADASAAGPSRDRLALLGVARMLRRIDQLTVGLSRDLTGRSWVDAEPTAAGGARPGGGPRSS